MFGSCGCDFAPRSGGRPAEDGALPLQHLPVERVAQEPSRDGPGAPAWAPLLLAAGLLHGGPILVSWGPRDAPLRTRWPASSKLPIRSKSFYRCSPRDLRKLRARFRTPPSRSRPAEARALLLEPMPRLRPCAEGPVAAFNASGATQRATDARSIVPAAPRAPEGA